MPELGSMLQKFSQFLHRKPSPSQDLSQRPKGQGSPRMDRHDYFSAVRVDEHCVAAGLAVHDETGSFKCTNHLPPVDITGEPCAHAVTRTSSTLA